jgi:plastocyanin
MNHILKRSSVITAIFVIAISGLYGGGIKGTVKYEGKVPKMRPLKMAADPICDMKHDAPVRAEWLLAGPGGELKNVFVYVKEGVKGDYPAPSEAEVIDQKDCVYKPHVLGVQAGQPIDILNSDGTLHNVHALPKKSGNAKFNEAMPGARKKITKKFNTPEIMVKIKCDVHPWMGTFVGVVDHPFYAVTAEDGSYEIKGLPAGTYTIEVWHEKLPAKTATVTIKGEETATADFTLKRPAKKKK